MPLDFPPLTVDLCIRWLLIAGTALLITLVSNVLLREVHVKLVRLASTVAASFSAAIAANALFDSMRRTTPDIWVFGLFGAAIGLIASISFELAFGQRSTRSAHLKSAAFTILIAATAGFLDGSMIGGEVAIFSLTVIGTAIGTFLAVPDLIFAFLSPPEILPEKPPPPSEV